ncbi:checkpoint protein HUS1-like isoform X2 [Artemia franciscana]|nr:hypothetical protein QYM36_016883 [Artemia franciscana]KAK2704648.1 hypothetical protein QYM36_016883 [Artemia franciscana]
MNIDQGTGRLGTTGIGSGLAWCFIPSANFFAEFLMEGLCPAENLILLEFNPSDVTKTLFSVKSSLSAKAFKMKLTKKYFPCLTFEVELPSASSYSRHVVHDIPVTVIPRRLWSDYKDPQREEFDATVVLPSIRTVKNIIDRLKNLDPVVEVIVNRNGDVEFKCESSMVTVTSRLTGLSVKKWSTRSDTDQDAVKKFSTRVDLKKFAHFLSGDVVTAGKVCLSINDGGLLHLNVQEEGFPISFQFFQPGLYA